MPQRQLVGLWCSVAVVTFSLQAAGLSERLRFDRALVDQGQIWLVLTGQFVHLSWAHWGLNMAGLGLVAYFFSTHGRPLHWLGVLLSSAAFSGLGVYWFNPETITLVGLSAILNGLFLFGAAIESEQDRLSGAVLLSLLIGKLAWEQLSGPMPGSASLIGGHVVTDAHVYGALGGVFALMLFSPQTLGTLLRRTSRGSRT